MQRHVYKGNANNSINLIGSRPPVTPVGGSARWQARGKHSSATLAH